MAYWDCVKVASSACGKVASAAPKIVHIAPWMLAAYMAVHPVPVDDCASGCHWVIPKEEFAPGGMFGAPLLVPESAAGGAGILPGDGMDDLTLGGADGSLSPLLPADGPAWGYPPGALGRLVECCL